MPVVELGTAELDLNASGLELLLYDDLLGVALRWVGLPDQLTRDRDTDGHPPVNRALECVDERCEVTVDPVDGDVDRLPR